MASPKTATSRDNASARVERQVSRGRDPRAQGAARRQEILDAACELIYARGYASASMRDLAGVVGVTQAALYYHFANKEDILFALIEGFTKKLSALLQDALQAGDGGVAGLEDAIRAHIMLARSHYREFKLVTEDKKLLGEVYSEAMRKGEREIFLMYRDAIAELKERGLIAPVNISVSVFNILAMINFVPQWYRADGELSLEDVADETVALAMKGLLAKPAD
ncbi:TetR/AcrR family transcriptional regulator [Hoeflea sp. WL0058]|uniref:TetR/AcrR family transcriptional regulator n=1 Tax=Flavimaribacter sediminis TaxID=2865987 RepID=A0AAE2ZL21_9HYPH|nr:TetR/AcrR family transcriptional regulator [Flavimaribacter sediminis]MBW8636238.1 TetR/AcrR family transcriptional regulator [Flavimaribacter sediminis]